MNKIIRVFLASSDELENDRYKFGDLIRKLNSIYKRYGIEIELIKWEDLDASYQGRRTQDMYNEIISKCNMFTAIFYKQAGKFTIEEFDVARECFDNNKYPKVYTYVKDLPEGESETQELVDFKKKLYDELGHYWCRYGNNDTMQLHFVLQLQLLESESKIKLEVKDTQILVDNHKVADLNSIPFASMNKEFIRLRDGIEKTKKRIERCSRRLDEDPNDEESKEELSEYIEECNKMNEDFDIIQNALLRTAISVAQLKGEEYDQLLQRAIEDFEGGNLEGAHTRLQEASLKVSLERESYKLKKESLVIDRLNLIKRIKQLLLDAEVVIGVELYLIDDRVDRADKAYREALLTAIEIEYDRDEHCNILLKYARFLNKYAKYKESIEIYNSLITYIYDNYEANTILLADVYDELGLIYVQRYVVHNENRKSIEYFNKALEIKKQFYSINNDSIAKSYSYLSVASWNLYKSQSQSVKYELESLKIRESLNREADYNYLIAQSYNGLGCYMWGEDIITKAQFKSAMDYFDKALLICNTSGGKCVELLENIYSNISTLNADTGKPKQALHYMEMALDLVKKRVGDNHKDLIPYLSKTGKRYSNLRKESIALEYFNEALRVCFITVGKYTDIADDIYSEIASVYKDLNDTKQEISALKESLNICKKVYGVNHSHTIDIQRRINLKIFDSSIDKKSGTLDIVDGVINIPSYKFKGNEEIVSAIIPNSVEFMGESVFENCINLESVILSNKLIYIRECLFWNCKRLKTITIPDTVTYIDENAFGMCESLTDITIPKSVETVREKAFNKCINLKFVTILNRDTEFKYGDYEYPFIECYNLKTIYIPKGTMEHYSLELKRYIDLLKEV